MSGRSRLAGLLPVLALVLTTSLAARGASAKPDDASGADDGYTPWFHERVDLKLAAIFAFHNASFKIGDFDFDLENDLNTDDFTVEPSFDLTWRFTENRKHRFALGYFGSYRNGKAKFAVLDPAVTTETDFSISVLDLTYGYSFLHDERKELGIFLGLNFIFTDIDLKLTDGTDELKIADDTFDVPFPTAGLYFNWAFTERLALLNKFQYFGLKLNDVEGALFRGNFRLQHNTWDHVGFYFGYELFGATADVENSSVRDLSDFSHGPTLGIDLRF